MLYWAMTLPGRKPYTSIADTDGNDFLNGGSKESSTLRARDLNCNELVSLSSAVKLTSSLSSDCKKIMRMFGMKK